MNDESATPKKLHMAYMGQTRFPKCESKNYGRYHRGSVNITFNSKRNKCHIQKLFEDLRKLQSTVRKKMAAVHFTTIPCEPNRAISTHRKSNFGEIHPCTKIVYTRYEVFQTFSVRF